MSDQSSRLVREANTLKEDMTQREGKVRDMETSSLVPLLLHLSSTPSLILVRI